ncbi:DNA-binding protein [Burkholderia savannae]|uniref:DNA-binding protein n=1 Tax=Burkholderia savannae TaxID=1637837 RepID=UPI0039C92B7E
MPRNTPGGRLRRVDTQVRLPRIPNFRYGVTPTASRLYSLVRKGSMSTPADVLNRFWQDLRDRTRVKIDHPDLPDVMKQVAAEAVLTIWRAASERATTELAALRAEARHQTHEAQAIRDQTIVSVEAAQQEVVTAQAQLDAGRAQLAESREALSAERQAHAATDARLQETRRQLDDASHQRAQLKIEFDIELEHARERAEAAETRALAHEKRALREIDQERTARQKSEKHLEELRAQLAAAKDHLKDIAVQHAATLATSRTELGLANQQTETAVHQYHTTIDELARTRSLLQEAQSRAGRAETEAEITRRLVGELSQSSAARTSHRTKAT